MILAPEIEQRSRATAMGSVRDVAGEQRLSSDEEIKLASLIANGDREARNRMVQANLRLVVTIARAFRGRGLEFDDLVGEGNLGLIRAVEKFDPRFGKRFSIYASYWIKEAIRHALRNTASTIRLPCHMMVLLTKWRRAERALSHKRDCPPRFDEVSSFLGLSEAQKEMVIKAHKARDLRWKCDSAMECDWQISNESIVGRDSPEPAIEADDQWRNLLRRMERLDSRERTVVVLRYGLNGERPLSGKETGSRLGISRESVRKIEQRAVRKLGGDCDD
jgi:RNA polymerase primary sigma factor